MSEAWVKRLMFDTDIGFLLYWLANAVQVIPPYPSSVLNAWNWSFLALDVLAAGTGLASLHMTQRCRTAAGGIARPDPYRWTARGQLLGPAV